MFGHPISKRAFTQAAAAIAASAAMLPVMAQQAPIKIGLTTAVQLQVGRDTQVAARIAIDEVNAKGGVLGRKLLEIVTIDTMDRNAPAAGDETLDRIGRGRFAAA